MEEKTQTLLQGVLQALRELEVPRLKAMREWRADFLNYLLDIWWTICCRPGIHRVHFLGGIHLAADTKHLRITNCRFEGGDYGIKVSGQAENLRITGCIVSELGLKRKGA